MGSVKDPREMEPMNALIRHPNDLLPQWHDFVDLFQTFEDIIIFIGSITSFIPDSPFSLARPIL